MNYLLRTVVGFIVGAICGAIVGAAMLAVPTYLDDSCGFLGCVRDWTPIAVYMGIMLGGAPGALIGSVVGIANFDRLKSMGIGGFIGLLIAIILFGMGAYGDETVSALAILSIPGGALVGLIVKEFLRLAGIFRRAQFE